jgi:6-methylsalicylic acid synthase
MCAAANRISYALDLRGPSLAVDTACSASLVAVHLACQSLRLGESTVAVAAGVNLIVGPGLTLTLDSAGAMAADGRCKSFDASADGYGRGEGAGVLVLKRLADAQRDGDRVLAVIRGSAVNQDGRTNGIMAPSGDAQRHVVAAALRYAEVAPSTVDYVEAHGTGTRLGDPLEASALSAVYGTGRDPARPLLIGSVKPNIGHLEAGAGVASLIKAVLALHRSEIPPSLNFSTPNPAIDWSALRVVSARTPWPSTVDGPRRAGVSGFGYGGTIAHVVLEEAPSSAFADRSDVEGVRLFPLSSASETGLRAQAGALADWLSGPGAAVPLAGIGHTLAMHRSHLEHRAAVAADSSKDLAEKLRRIAAGEADRELATGAVPAQPGAGLVWVFSGHGSQWAGMGRELLGCSPVFASVIDTLEPIFQAEIGFSPRQVLLDGDLDSVDRIQTMIFAVQLGLAAVWRSYGVTPDAVIGHSVGEIAAAVAAGALSTEDGARLICRRSKLLRRVAGQGAMVMVSLPFDEVAQRLAGRTDVVPAIWSSPGSTVVAGDVAAIEALAERWQAEEIQVRRVASDVAFHSPHMDPLLDDLVAAAAPLSSAPPRIPMYSTALTDPHGFGVPDGHYWAANLRNPVRLSPAVSAAIADGYRNFLEVSAHPVVSHSIGETLGEDGFVGVSLRRNQPELATLLTGVGALHCQGVPVDWAALQPAGELVTLPGVAWQHRRHWRDMAAGTGTGGLQHEVDSHALLGAPATVAGSPVQLWRTYLDEASRPYPGSHTINGVEIAPAAVLVNTFLTATGQGTLTDIALRVPLPVGDRREIQVVRDDAALRIASRAEDGDWLTHVSGSVGSPLPVQSLPGVEELEPADPDSVQRHLASVGVPTMGFHWTISELWRGEGVLRARVSVPEPAGTWAPVLDAALSIAPCAIPGAPTLRMVGHLGRVTVSGPPPVDVTIEARVHGDAVDVSIVDRSEAASAYLAGVRYEAMEANTRSHRPEQLVHELVWRPLALTPGPARRLALIGPEWLRDSLIAAGADCRIVIDVRNLDGVTDLLVLPYARGTVPEAAERAAWQLLSIAQRLPAGPKLWCLTTGVRESATEAHLAHGGLWGLGRVLSGEYPDSWGGIVDLPGADPASVAKTLYEVIRTGPKEDVICLRDGGAEVARLARPSREPLPGQAPGREPLPGQASGREPVRDKVSCRRDGTYLVTGGLGVLGLEVARWLAARGATRLVLAGRRPFPARRDWDSVTDGAVRGQIESIRELEAAGVTVRTLALDITDAAQAARLLAPDSLELPPIRGIVHAAGVLDNRMAGSVDPGSLKSVLAPKVAGAWVLHQLFPPGSLDFLVLFSSCGQLLGLPGQASYGTANAWLDALATHRGNTMPGNTDTVSLGWTSWRGKGMAVNTAVDAELHARGAADISAPEAFGAWDLAHRYGLHYAAVLPILPAEPGMERLPLLSELSTVDAPPAQAGEGELTTLGPAELRAHLLDVVAGQIAAEMRLATTDLDPRRSLAEQGLDSVMTIVIRRRLEKRFGHRLPATLLWHQPTVAAIADHLAELLSGPAEPPAQPAPAQPAEAAV